MLFPNTEKNCNEPNNLTSDFGLSYHMATYRSNVASRVQDAGVSLSLHDNAAGVVTPRYTPTNELQ